jgi:GNAT superfamily N-acetyltransferase
MRILLNWGTGRPDHLVGFQWATRGMDVVLVDRRDELIGLQASTEGRQIFWEDFATPQRLLDAVRPDKVVFSDIEQFHQVALNAAARARGIPTLMLEHGIRTAREVEVGYRLQQEMGNRERLASFRKVKTSSATLAFYLSALPSVPRRQRLQYLRFVTERWGREPTAALHACRFDARLATRYVNFAPMNATYLMARDALPLSRFVLIGNPSYDQILAHVGGLHEKDAYYLLIDSPVADHPMFPGTRADKVRFLLELARYAERKGARLRVKLHPMTYASDYLPTHPAIEYFRDADIVPLLKGARGIFGFNSSLITVAPLFAPTVLFHINEDAFTEDLVARGVAGGGLDYFRFEADDVERAWPAPTEAATTRMIDDYLYRADGRAAERLREVLGADAASVLDPGRKLTTT